MTSPSSTNDKDTVLITGASSGIGRELARQFASHGHPVVLISPVPGEIGAVAGDIRSEFGVEATPLPGDIGEPEAARMIADALDERGIEIGILVNNAGVGERGNFWEIPLERDIEMIRVNVEATVRMTKQFLPRMVARGSGRVLNTASIAGFEPGPMLAVYHATKAFVLSLSEALATELEDTGVTVTALCPGPTDTDFFPKAGMVDTRVFQEGNVMGPREVAEAGYEALMRGDRVIVPGTMNKAAVFGRRLMPEGAQAAKNEKLYEDAHLDHRKRERGDVEKEERRKEAEAQRR